MATNPFELRLAPFGWRVLWPGLAGILPVSTSASFRVLTFATIWATAVAVFVLLRKLGHGNGLAAVGMLLALSLRGVAAYPLHNFWLPDSAVFLAVVVLAIAAVDRRPLLFLGVLVVGALAKEQVLIAAPLWYGLGTDRLIDWRRLGQMLLLAVPAIVVVLAVRGLLPAENTDPAYRAQIGTEIDLNANDHLPHDEPLVLYRTFGEERLPDYPRLLREWSLAAFSFLPLLGLAAPRRGAVTLLRWAPFLIVVLLQPLLASDDSRLLTVAFPVAVVLAVDGLAAIRRRVPLPAVAPLAGAAAMLVVDLVSQQTLVPLWYDPLAFGATTVVVALLCRLTGHLRTGEAMPARDATPAAP